MFLLGYLVCSFLVDPADGPGLSGPYTEQAAGRGKMVEVHKHPFYFGRGTEDRL